MKTRVVFFGEKLTFPIMKANYEPEMLKLYFNEVDLYLPTFRHSDAQSQK